MRRMFRRDRRKEFAAHIPPILQEANMAFDKGEYGRAAQLFERIAEPADARGGPRAPLFHLQAGRARRDRRGNEHQDRDFCADEFHHRSFHTSRIWNNRRHDDCEMLLEVVDVGGDRPDL